MHKYYVYAYLRADRQSPYYIGKGTGNRVNATHDNCPLPPHDRRAIIKDNLTERDALDLEALLVKQWGRQSVDGGVLMNRSHGFTTGTAMMGNQHAKGVKHDKNADWFIKVSQKRAQCRHWNDGQRGYFRVECPPGCVPGRLGGWKRNQVGANNSKAAKWQLTYKDGHVIVVTALKAWCHQNGVDYSAVYWSFRAKKPYKDIMEVTKL